MKHFYHTLVSYTCIIHCKRSINNTVVLRNSVHSFIVQWTRVQYEPHDLPRHAFTFALVLAPTILQYNSISQKFIQLFATTTLATIGCKAYCAAQAQPWQVQPFLFTSCSAVLVLYCKYY